MTSMCHVLLLPDRIYCRQRKFCQEDEFLPTPDSLQSRCPGIWCETLHAHAVHRRVQPFDSGAAYRCCDQLQAYLQVDRGPCCGSEAQSCSPPSPPFSRRLAVAAMCAKSGGGLHFSCTWKKRAAIQRPILKSVDTSASPERIRGSATEAMRKLASMKPRPAMRPHSTTALPNAP